MLVPKLISLKGGPIEVCGYFSCSSNQLTTLEGGPQFVGSGFYCHVNLISEKFYTIFNSNYNLYRKYIKRQKILKQLIND